ncbi:MAG: FIST C-terminal domain-containing protein [Magnetococcales bacterium]|nr:FIST C-terminal domain-containing protein [Magnetococcales bacterium]
MKIEQYLTDSSQLTQEGLAPLQRISPDLILVFSALEVMADPLFLTTLQQSFPTAKLAGCSTAGEISREGVSDGGAVITAISFEKVQLHLVETQVANLDDSFRAGAELGRQLAPLNPKAVTLFGPGIDVNGSAIINGINSELTAEVLISGGLAGDGGQFKETLTLSPSGLSARGVVAMAFCGEDLLFGHGSFGGWSPFGPARKITRCSGNILYELDGEPALNVYKKYLGDHARDLPASGLLFPFEMLDANHSQLGLIRTILGIDPDAGSLTLAGEIDPEGYLRLMHANVDDLVDGAEEAAHQTLKSLAEPTPGLAMLISCVGRKLVMGDQVDDEVEAVAETLHHATVLTGFYSYGEISPLGEILSCKLHNQTMTIAFIGER